MPSIIPSNNGLLGSIPVEEEQEQGQPMVAPVIEGAAPVVPAATPTAPVDTAAPEDFWADDEDSLLGETEVIHEDEDALMGTPGVSEATEHFSTFDNYVSNANKIAYGAVKGIVGIADLATAPAWALANVVMPEGTANTMPFSKMLEAAYPAKAYIIEDADGYADEMMRFAQTTAEFVMPAGPMNIGAKAAGKMVGAAKGLTDDVALGLADAVGTSVVRNAEGAVVKGAQASMGYTDSIAREAAYGAASAFAYQGVLEADGGQGLALTASFLAPMSPQVAKAGWSLTSAAPKTAWRVGERTLLVGPVLSELRMGKEIAITNLQTNLKTNPQQWEGNVWGRMAKKAVLSVEETVAPLDTQINNLRQMKDRIDKILPQDNAEVASHVTRMKSMQDLVNKSRGVDDQLELTLDQIYRPALNKMNDTDGLDKLLGVAKLTNADAYNAQIRQNQRVFGLFLDDGFDKLDGEDTEAFMHVFRSHLDDINTQQELITSQALKTDFMGDVSNNTIYEFPHLPMEQELVKATENLRTLMGNAYDGMLNKLDGDIELDTTPIKNAITEAYTDMGTLGDPRAVPAYMKSLMQKLVAIGDSNNPAKIEEDSVHKQLLNRESELGASQTGLKREKNDIVKAHKAKLASIDTTMDVKEARALRKQYQAEYEKNLEPITEARKPIDDELASITVAKREKAIQAESEFEKIPEPNFTNLDSVRRAVVVVAKDRREAFRAGDMDKYQNLTTLYRGLESTMDSLREIDAPAYEMYSSVNGRYKDFVSRDFNESNARIIIDKKGGHERKLTSDQAVSKVWSNGDAESVQRFMRNFDDTRNGLDDYLKHADNEDIKGADAMAENAERGVKAMQDVIFTDMAQGLREFNLRTYNDPAKKVADIEAYVRKYLTKNESKLVHVPGFEQHPDVLRKILKDLGDYSAQMKELDEQKNLGILNNITGPGRTILDIANDPTKAQEMANMLDNMAQQTAGQMDISTNALSAEQMRKTMFNSLMQKFTSGEKFDGDGMLSLLNQTGESRYNLQLVLGDQQVLKLEAMARLSIALRTGETTMSESLQSDALLKGLDDVGFGLGRMGSILSKRVAFSPSTGYLAGSMMAKVLDKMTQKQTARSLKILMDNPFDLMELDNFVLKSIDELTDKRKAIVDRALRNRSLGALVGWFDKGVARTMHGHLSTLGYKVTESELATIIREHLLEELPEETKAEAKANKAPVDPTFQPTVGGGPTSSPAPTNAPAASQEAPAATPDPVQSGAPQAPQKAGIASVPQVASSDPTSATSTRKPMSEIRDRDVTRAMNGMTAQERLRYMENLNKEN